jgi:hypothetical protein
VIDVKRLAVGVLLATIGLVVVLGAHPVPTETILAGYAIVLAAVALTGLTTAVGSLRRQVPSRFEHELSRRRHPPTRPHELVKMERELTLAESGAGHFHTRLRPLLLDIAEARGVEIDLPSEPPQDPAAPGLPLRRIAAIVEELERP